MAMSGSRPLALLLVFAAGAFAQDITQRYAPKPPPEAPGPAHALPPEPTGPENDTRPIIPELRGIRFVPAKDAVRPAGASVASVRGVDRAAIEVPAPAEFDRIAAAPLGKPLSLASLNRLIRELVLLWRRNDRPVVDIIVPEQDITSGVLQLIVLEGRVGEIRVEGAQWFAPRKLARQVRLKPGDRIRASVLNADLDWLNNNSFRRVNLIYTPGSHPGATDLVLKTEDRLPVRVYLSYEDTGVEPAPHREWLRDRWQLGANWGNAFGAGQLLSYQFTTSDDLKNVRAHAISYAVPLPWRHTVMLSASYSESETTTGASVIRGLGWGGSLRYLVPLPGAAGFVESVSLGMDWSRSNSNLDFGGVTQYTEPVEIRQFAAEYQASLQDRWGAQALDASFIYSPGNWAPANRDARFAQTRSGADSHYTVGKLTLERLTRLPWNCSLSTRATGQLANGPLAPAEAFYLGGWDSVRGYEQAESHGDHGCTVQVELRAPPFSLGRWRWKSAPDQLQFLGFWDYGWAETIQPLVGQARTSELSGAGIGLRYTVGRWTSIRFDYGCQLLDPGAASTVSKSYPGRAHLGVMMSY